MSVAKGIIQYSQTYATFTHTLGIPMDSLTSSFPTRIDSRGAPVDHARHTSSRADTYGAPQQSPGVTLSQDACTMLPVEVLSPAADVGALGGRVREVCEEYLLTGKHIDKPNLPAPALAERKQECELLRGRGYVQAPRDNVASYTAHHWVHTWIPGYQPHSSVGDTFRSAVPIAQYDMTVLSDTDLRSRMADVGVNLPDAPPLPKSSVLTNHTALENSFG